METSIYFLRGAPAATPGKGCDPVTDDDALRACRQWLAEHAALAALHDPVAQQLVERARFVRYRAGYAVMSAGEQGDRIALLLGGRCRVIEPDGGDAVAFVGPGDLLGEMSILSSAPRRHTVVAIRDTLFAEIPLAELEALEAPIDRVHVRAWLAETAARRALGLGGERPPGVALTVLPLSEAEGPAFADALAAAFEALGERCAVVRAGDFDGLPTPLVLERIAQDNVHVVYLAERGQTAWNALAIRQADRLLRVADAADDPKKRGFDFEAEHAAAPSLLVLMQAPDARVAQGTARWLDPRGAIDHLHARRGRADDLQRIARVATRRGRGVIFAGASSQGIGYVGMVRAFEQMGYAPDIIAGNSSGAIAAAVYADGGSSEQMRAHGQSLLTAISPRLSALTLPLVSFLTGRRMNRSLRAMFGDTCLEDLLLPCMLTAVDISAQRRVDIRRGPVWRAVRATMSLPMIYPPLVDDDGVLVDGGTLENYPIDQIDPLCRDGQVLVCDLSQAIGPMLDVARYGAELSGWRVLWQRLWPFGRKQSYPTIPEVLFRTATLASQVHAEQLAARAKPNWVFLRPEAPSPGLFGLTPALQSALIADVEAEVLARRGEIMGDGPGEET